MHPQDTPPPSPTKRCRLCGLDKPLSAYNKHQATADRLRHECKTCRNQLTQTWREQNRDAYNASARAYNARNRARVRANTSAYRKQNRARASGWARKWKDAHREYLSTYVRIRYQTDPEYRAAAQRTNQRRRARLQGVYFEDVDTAVVAERDHWRCHICGKRVTRANWSLDHIVPISRGGPHIMDNVKLAHRNCNSRRGAGFLPGQGFLPGLGAHTDPSDPSPTPDDSQ